MKGNCWQCSHFNKGKSCPPCKGCDKVNNFRLWILDEIERSEENERKK